MQSFYHISKIEPVDYVHNISPRAMLHLAAITGVLTDPIEGDKKVFEEAGEPKWFIKLNNYHIANYFGDSFEENVSA